MDEFDFDNPLEPDEAAVRALLDDPSDEPVGMLNLLKFKPQAEYDDPNEPARSGAEAYMLYGMAAQKRLTELGGGIVFFTGVTRTIITGALDEWDAVALAHYPRARDFPRLIESQEYVDSLKHRKAGLLRTQVIQVAMSDELKSLI